MKNKVDRLQAIKEIIISLYNYAIFRCKCKNKCFIIA